MELPQALLDQFQVRRVSRANDIDNLPADIRALVNEFNWTMIKAFLDAGVRDARKIRHLICRVIEGAACYDGEIREERTPTLKLSEKTAVELSRRADIVVCHIDPLDQVVQASMDAVLPYVPGTPLLTKRQKHRIRLRAAFQTAKTISKL
jgi:hypothetical protein